MKVTELNLSKQATYKIEGTEDFLQASMLPYSNAMLVTFSDTGSFGTIVRAVRNVDTDGMPIHDCEIVHGYGENDELFLAFAAFFTEALLSLGSQKFANLQTVFLSFNLKSERLKDPAFYKQMKTYVENFAKF